MPQIADLQRALAEKALAHAGTVMPGFTHLQTAQPVTFGHHLLAYVEMLARDRGRFGMRASGSNESPLGAAALAGTSFPIDREMTAKALGFDRPTANSLDSVSDRDFALEALAAAAICAVHLSRFAEEIVLWTTPQFGFVTLSDAFTTGSSIMPQKRNPDAAELVRGKAGRIFGALQALLVVMKGLPLAYSKDMQEDKEGAFDALQSLSLCLAAMAGMVRGHRARHRADERGGRRGLRDRHRPRRLAGARARSAVPRGPSCDGPHRRGRREAQGRAGEADARGDAGRRAAHHQGGVFGAGRRQVGREPHELWRHRARQRARAGAKNGSIVWGRRATRMRVCLLFLRIKRCVVYSRASPERNLRLSIPLAPCGCPSDLPRRDGPGGLRPARAARAAARAPPPYPNGDGAPSRSATPSAGLATEPLGPAYQTGVPNQQVVPGTGGTSFPLDPLL